MKKREREKGMSEIWDKLFVIKKGTTTLISGKELVVK